ncbi:MAG: hypothetical protein ACI837_001909 [Crocinitomicaceae bacterium]|jgi:uncharacterized protein (DUF1684 family)
MKNSITTIFILCAGLLCAQKSSSEIQIHRAEHITSLTDTAAHVLNFEEVQSFGGLDYFDFDSTYQITATFKKSKGKIFEMPTSTERLPKYRRYGIIEFTHAGTKCRLEVYQNMVLKKSKEHKDYLFIPFRDGSSSKDSYGGGRYLDVKIPKGKELLIDFNLAYNPYCAYSHRYSCPIPPAANTLNVSINAGEKTPMAH